LEPAFGEGFAKGVLARLRSNLPDSTLSTSRPAESEDLSVALATHYRPAAGTGPSRLSFIGHSRLHPQGAARRGGGRGQAPGVRRAVSRLAMKCNVKLLCSVTF
jgi:hypothetical protein